MTAAAKLSRLGDVERMRSLNERRILERAESAVLSDVAPQLTFPVFDQVVARRVVAKLEAKGWRCELKSGADLTGISDKAGSLQVLRITRST